MNDLDRLLLDAEAYAKASDKSINTVSRWLFGDGTRIRKIREDGATATVAKIEKARSKLHSLWEELEEPAQC